MSSYNSPTRRRNMADIYLPDWGTAIKALYEAYYDSFSTERKSTDADVKLKVKTEDVYRDVLPNIRRNSVCIAGLHRESVMDVKRKLHATVKIPMPLESFHVKIEDDIKDGAFLVPKIILVAVHSPGRKVIDEDEDRGQLDFLYDEACRVSADLLVMYVGLPRKMYPPVRSAYHPKIAEMLFPRQPLLRLLAQDNCFLTVTEKTELNAIQKNILLEWIETPSNMENILVSEYEASIADDVIFQKYEVQSEIMDSSKNKKITKSSDEPSKKYKRKLKKKSKRYTFENERPLLDAGNANIELEVYDSSSNTAEVNLMEL